MTAVPEESHDFSGTAFMWEPFSKPALKVGNSVPKIRILLLDRDGAS